jgi:predicted ATPase
MLHWRSHLLRCVSLKGEIDGCAWGRSDRSIRASLYAARATGTKLYRPYFCALLADACLLAGRFAEGLAAVYSGLEAARSTNDRLYEAELLRLGGELIHAGNMATEHCATWFERAIEIAKHQEARLLELRALTSLVRSGEAQPRAGELLARVAVVLEQLTPTRDGVDAREARALLAS